jgi:hypothetical protein
MLKRTGLGLVSLTAVVIAALFSACSGSSAPVASGPSAQQACADDGQAVCARLDACVKNGIAIQYGDAGACLARQEPGCTASLAANASGRTTSGYEACAAVLPSESCTDYLNNNNPTACKAPAGTLAVGTVCGFSAQCVTAFCAIPPASACGTCQPPPAAGATCADLDTCGPNLVCVKGTCVAYGASGAACNTTQLCGTGLTCVTAAMQTSGTCQASGESVGTACDPTRQTGPGCDGAQGLYCDGATKQCAAIAYATAGQPCGFVGGVFNECTGAAGCFAAAGPDGGTTSTCIAAAAEGQTCNTLTGPPCARPARCLGTLLDGGTSGTCALATVQCH